MNKNTIKPLLLAIVSAYAAQAAFTNAESLNLDKVEVYSTTPLKGIGLPLHKVPANIQMAKPAAINNQTGVSIADYMNNNMQGVTVTELGGNPWQPEINFRGYSASSLLGNPQGLSTYIDGVRVNEPFGDVTSWDKIPNFAIDDIQLVPRSNPLYDLNTLGGAIAIQTKSGRNNQGLAVEAEMGSWGRKRGLLEFGGVSKDGSVDYMIGYQHISDDGWRKYSPSRVNQLFAKTGWQSETTKLDLTYIGADNRLIGNGLTPEFLLSGDNDQIHTRPDATNNYSHFLALNGSHWLSNDTMLSGNVYYKKSNRRTVNGDGYEGSFEDVGGVSTLDGYPGITCSQAADDCEVIGSVSNRTHTSQDTYGATGQATFNQDFLGKENQFVIGAGYDYSLIRFKQSEQINLSSDSESIDDGDITGTTGSDTVFDPTRAPVLEGDGALGKRQTVGLTGKQYTARLFATDTLSLNEFWHLNAGASWNFTRVDNVDTLRGSPSASNGFNSLTARDSYTRLNPTVGMTFTPTKQLTIYSSYSESSRAPTAIELGCSNPASPCLLPAALADDPPLNQVVAKTYEFGGRGQLADNLFWNAGVYHAVNHDDIQFTAANTQTGAGYFKNVGRSKRQGIDLGLNGVIENFKWSASYSFVHATYDNDVEFANGSNSTGVNSDGIYTARAGDRLPAIPQHQLKLRGQYAVTPSWNIGTNVVGYSDQFVYGNENNGHQSNAADCNGGDDCAVGRGKLSGYFIVNLDTQYNFGNGWKLFAKATNIFDKDYYIAGRLAESLFDASGTFGSESKVLSLLPGAPRAAWFGFRYEFGAKPSLASYDRD
jgi:outer membrane receptor protein involved in Fe transport